MIPPRIGAIVVAAALCVGAAFMLSGPKPAKAGAGEGDGKQPAKPAEKPAGEGDGKGGGDA